MAIIPDFKGRSFELYKRLLRDYVWKYHAMLGVAFLSMVLVAGTTAGNAWLMKPVLNDIFINHEMHWLVILPALLVILAFGNALGDYGQALALKYVGQRVVSDMQVELFAKLMSSDLTTFHDQTAGRLISRLTSDIMLMRQSVSQVVTGIVKESLTLLFLIVVMVLQGWKMSVIAVSVLVFAVVPILRLGKKMRRIADSTQSQLADFTAQLDDTFQGVRVVKAYGREGFEVQRAKETIRRLFKLYYKAARVQSASGPVMAMLGGIAVAAVVWYGGFKVMHGETTPGGFFAFIAALLMAYRPVKTLAGLNTQLQEGMAAAGRFFSVIDITPAIRDKDGAATLTVTTGDIRFDAVSFHYGEGAGGVDDLTFAVPAGKMVALVGASGAGKSTIMNLLLRFYDVDSGRISIDGSDIRDVTLASLRQSLALVSQDVILFDDTVRANIAYGREGASEEDIVAAAKHAHAHDFILQLPEGYDTPVGPLGVKLSGGQKQRISIARAILKNAPILLLDEATSALDTASEFAVQEALAFLTRGRTTLVIAHRLTTIQHAHTILVLQNGRIVDEGTHEQLLAGSESYRNMHRLYTSGAA
ncbi:MAG: ABC transporter ATP-binding protein [Alphaproteobacteria bacterium]